MPRPKVSARALFFSGFLALCGWAVTSGDAEWLEEIMPIRHVRVEGEIRNLDAAEFTRILLPWTQGGYFLADMRGIEKAAKAFPWVDSVQVVRLWPDTLQLKIVEQKPVARSGDGGLINSRGERFLPGNAQSYARLPMLDGAQGQEKQLLNMLRLLNAKLKQRGLRIDVLRLTNRRAWSARLSGGVDVEFGKQDPALALDRLLALLPRLGEERVATIRKLDLRYPNGFAVIFKPQFPAELVSLKQPDSVERG